MTDDQYLEWVAGVQGLYDEMVVITITPTWAKLLDFETTLPKAVEDPSRRGRPLTAYGPLTLATHALVAATRSRRCSGFRRPAPSTRAGALDAAMFLDEMAMAMARSSPPVPSSRASVTPLRHTSIIRLPLR